MSETSLKKKIRKWLYLKGLSDSFSGISAALQVIEELFFHLSHEKPLIVTIKQK